MTDTELPQVLTAAARRDAEAFASLYADLEPRIYPFVVSRVGRQEIATDLTQDIITDIFLAVPNFSYRTVGQWYAFVFTIVRRTLARHYKDHARKQAQFLDVETSVLPDTRSDETVTTMAVDQALAQLDQITRDIVVLHHWSRYTFAEIALMLNLEEGTVRTRHHRAKTTLASLLNA
jgi:RNA polymerase sigma-70 factor (ECF subfamily)